MHFVVSELRARLRVEGAVKMPFHPGGALRGVLGRALRKVACARDGRCGSDCEQPRSCAFGRLRRPIASQQVGGRGERPPIALVPEFPWYLDQPMKDGEELEIGVKVLGEERDKELLALRRAFVRFRDFPIGRERDGRLRLVAVREVSREEKVGVAEGREESGRLRVEMLTPTWLEKRKRLMVRPDLEALFKLFHWRVKRIATHYGTWDEADEARFPPMLELARRARARGGRLEERRWHHRKAETGERSKLAGVDGALEFEGPIGPLLPVLRAAEVVHVGKQTSFGLGRIAVWWKPR